MKCIRAIAIACMICFLLLNHITDSRRSDRFGFKITEFTVVEEQDTHGGFLGDGTYHLILDCSENSSRAHEIIKVWKELPLSDNLDLMMYGGYFAEEAHWPMISNGVYKFVDRHSESVNASDDTDLLSRYSFNFSIAAYDLDTDTLYYFEVDT